MRELLTSIFLLAATIQLIAQSDLISTYSRKNKELLVVNKMPEGDYFTVQVATVYGEMKYVGYDDRLIGSLILFNPVYLYSQGNTHNFSVGVFDSYEEASKYANEISCIFPHGPFTVAYSNGRKMSASSFSNATIPSNFKKLKRLEKWLKRELKQSFYRVRFGYFTQVGFTAEVQSQFDALADKGVEIISEPFKNGRLVLSKRKFEDIDEAIAFRDEQCGAYTDEKMIRRYYVDEGIWLDHMHQFYECLRYK